MKCTHCGQDITEGSLFCPACGKEIQIVPDYNAFDEGDYLRQVMAEEQKKHKRASASLGTDEFTAHTTITHNTNRKIMIVIIALLALLVLCVAIIFSIRHKNSLSPEYQIHKAEQAYSAGETDKAIHYYEKAIELDHSNLATKIALFQIYDKDKRYDSAILLGLKIMQVEPDNRDICRQLIQIYDTRKDYASILELYNKCDPALAGLFANYLVSPPEFSLADGTFGDFMTVELHSASDNWQIYFTLDGTDPTVSGKKYESPIELDSNLTTYQIQAVCRNEKGINSDIAAHKYTIEISAPDMPIVTPDGGDFGVPTRVTVTIPDNCSAYYTWDGSDPTMFSNQYKSPLAVPEGNHILSVMIVDERTHLYSDVYRGNFIYYVEPEDDGEVLPVAEEEFSQSSETSEIPEQQQ